LEGTQKFNNNNKFETNTTSKTYKILSTINGKDNFKNTQKQKENFLNSK
jgi:hypothetical protein